MFGNKKKDVNPVFDKKWKEYKATVEQLRTLEDNLKHHLKVTEEYVNSCSKISVQIGHFFKSSEEVVSKRTTHYGHLNSEKLEFGCFKAIDKLYHEEILEPMEVLWKMDKENQAAFKERKRLLKVYAQKQKASESKKNEKENLEKELRIERETGKERKGRFGKKRKSITEVNLELQNRQTAEKEAGQQAQAKTEEIENKLDSLQTSRVNGELLSGAVSGVIACQLQLASTTQRELKILETKFKEVEVYRRKLKKYENATQKGLPLEQQNKGPAGFVFGRMLTTSTPDIVCDCISYIKTGIAAEGLFRIPGNRSNVERIKESYDKNEKHILSQSDDFDIHDVCSTLKFFFNNLPEPLIPYTCYEELELFFATEATGVTDDERIIHIIQRIPDPYIGLLGLLLNFLHDITRYEDSNQMTSTNLATCFAPVLLKPRPDPNNKDSTIESLKSMKNIAANIATVSILIDNARGFKVPNEKEILAHTNIDEDRKKKIRRAYMTNAKQPKPSRGPPAVPPKTAMQSTLPRVGNRAGMTFMPEDLQALSAQSPTNFASPTPSQRSVTQTEDEGIYIAKNESSVLTSKKRGFIRRESLDNADSTNSRPLPPMNSSPGAPAPPGLLSKRATFEGEEIPAALLGEPGTVAPPIPSRGSQGRVDVHGDDGAVPLSSTRGPVTSMTPTLGQNDGIDHEI